MDERGMLDGMEDVWSMREMSTGSDGRERREEIYSSCLHASE